jgi:hypothetical protein
MSVLFWLLLSVLPYLSYPCSRLLAALSWHPVLTVLSWKSCHGSFVRPVPFWLSFSNCLVLAVLFWLPNPVLSYPSCSVLPVLFCLFRSACPVLPILFCLSCSPVLFCLSVLPVPYCLSVLFCLSCSCLSCPWSPVGSLVLPVPLRLSYSSCPVWLSCSACPVLPVTARKSWSAKVRAQEVKKSEKRA